MALTGNLSDFGLADILQLIGQQQKTGTLHLRGKSEDVAIAFDEGNLVWARTTNRRPHRLLGAMMVRAEILTDKQLSRALSIQRRSLRRLGDILVEEQLASRDEVRQMYELQTSETIYRLFNWHEGTYEFAQEAVDWDRDTFTPMRSENVLMEGFRIVDEWPMVKKVITSPEMTFAKIQPLPAATGGGGGGSLDDDLEKAFGGGGDDDDDDAEIGSTERLIYRLAEPGETTQRIIDLSRMGEFETSKALMTLVSAGFLRAIPPARGTRTGRKRVGPSRASVFLKGLGGQVLTLAVIVGLAGGLLVAGQQLSASSTQRYLQPRSAESLLRVAQVERLRTAIEVHFAEKGVYPESLEQLVEEGLLFERDLSYPFAQRYYYRRHPKAPEGYLLLPPIP